MRIALFSDVHGNLSAFQAVLAAIDGQDNFDHVVFAGDISLFGPRPQETITLLRQRNIPAIVGNTDEWIRRPPPAADTLPEAERPARQKLLDLCRWTEAQLDHDSLRWLDDLRSDFQLKFSPSVDPADDLLVVHANPQDLLGVIFPSIERQQELYGRVRQSDDELQPILDGQPARTIAFGHLHIPGVRLWRNKKLFNISSVSLPGDGDGRAKYAVLEWNQRAGWVAHFFLVDYPVAAEISAFQERRPPGWQQQVEQLKTVGYVAQKV